MTPERGTRRAAVHFIKTLRRWLMGRYMLLWLLGVPIPILALIWAFGGLH
jgi:hypothetical protein